ncbi:DUF5320 domain-containing protein [Candidatus Micrarchaeota archaeon]|nr:DUF5320 domain-containing protein [Candidatus Micrarchaeota archaeon]
MPAGDGTGPFWGQGRWNCRRGYGRGMGMGFGRGGGFGRGFWAGYPAGIQPAKNDEIKELKSYADELGAELEEVRKRIATLEKRD